MYMIRQSCSLLAFNNRDLFGHCHRSEDRITYLVMFVFGYLGPKDPRESTLHLQKVKFLFEVCSSLTTFITFCVSVDAKAKHWVCWYFPCLLQQCLALKVVVLIPNLRPKQPRVLNLLCGLGNKPSDQASHFRRDGGRNFSIHLSLLSIIFDFSSIEISSNVHS